MDKRFLGQEFLVSPISYGAMGLSEFYGAAPSDEHSLSVLERALELGVTMFDTADMYGLGHNEKLLGQFFKAHQDDQKTGRIKVATKFGIERHNGSYERRINNSPEYIRQACEGSLRRLGLERIDLYYVHRVDAASDLIETIGVLSKLIREGKVAHIGLCEVSAKTLALAHQVHPITAVQSEYSLWTRDAENDILPMCRELGVGFVAYSPLGRGFLSGKFDSVENLDDNDFRRSNPRFQGDNLRHNLGLLEKLKQLAADRGLTPTQIALAWLLGKYEKLAVIPGTRKVDRLEENCAAAEISLSEDEAAMLESAFKPEAVYGERYTSEGMKGVGA